MKRAKITRRALVMSMLSLLLCVSMLVGTTFAWFTDNVTSGQNQIIAGNLDIELEYWNGTEWVDVEGKTDILTNTLWEPGVTEVAYLRLANAGSLALKYQLGINIVSEIEGVNQKDEPFKLSDYIQFGVVENVNGKTDAYATREAAVAAVADAKKISAGYTKATSMTAGQELYLALVVYMPTSVGNEANYKTGTTPPSINLGLSLFATQVEAELDSFGNDYDKDSWKNGIQVNNADELKAALAVGGDIVLGANIALDAAAEIPAGVTVNLDMNGNTISSLNAYVFENKGNLTIDGNGTFEGLGVIRSKAGRITINSGNFYASSRWQDGVYQHTLKAENTAVVINGGNFDATVNGQTNAMFNASENGTITINGGTFKNVAGALTQFDPYIFTYEKNGRVVINDGTFYGGWRFNGETATTDINGGEFAVGFDGQSFHANSTHVVSVSGGSFTAGTKLSAKLDSIVANGYKAVEAEGAYYVVPTDGQVATDAATLKEALAAGGTVLLANNITLAEAVTVPSGETTVLDMNGKTITGTNAATATHNDLFLVKGTLTVKNGTVTQEHTAANMGWNGCTNTFDITAGGVLNLIGMTVENKGGTDMNFAVHMNNWGEVTLNVQNSTLKAAYMPVRVYNSGPDMNNVTIEGSTLVGGNHAFWVHNYASADFGGKVYSGSAVAYDEAAVADRLNFDIYGNGNTFISGKTFPVRYGFNSSLYFDENGNIAVAAATTEELIAAIQNAPVGEETAIYLTAGEYAGDIQITVAALGQSGGDVVIKAAEGAAPVITGSVTLGYRNQGVGAEMYNANVTFEGITFDQADDSKHSIIVQDVKSLNLIGCTIIGGGEMGIDCARGNATGVSKIVDCTFENAGMQLLGNFATGLVIDGCTLNNSKINVQAGNGVTIQDCTFEATLDTKHVGDSFYMIRSNSTPITVKNCKISIDSKLTEVATSQAKWYLLANRGTTNWTVEGVEVTLTEAAAAQTELKVTACTSTGKINTTNLTVNGVVQ